MEEKNETKNTFYLSTPIYYVNDKPHLGHAYTTVLADALARYHRFLGEEVFFLTGTDEHGAKVARTAEKAGKKPEDLADENSQKFKDLFALLSVSNSDFIRTSDRKKHWKGVKKMWKEIEKKGDIYKDTYRGRYCVGCEAFVTEKDLVDGKCVYHDQKPEIIEEENYFFRLSKYTDEIKKLIKAGELEIVPAGRKNEVLALLEEGLKDVSFSRPSKDIGWGIPVPGDGTQTIYVWSDALSNYISALGFGGDESNFDKFWPANVHILAKDIIRFHTSIWPAMLLSAGLPLPKTFLVHGFINSGGKKMSKSIGNVVDPQEMAKKYGVDVLRYYLLREITPFEDGDFTEERLGESYQSALSRGLGNYVSRVTKMALSYFEGKVKKPDEVGLSDVPFMEKDERESFAVPYVFEREIWPEYEKQMVGFEVHKAADTIWSAISRLDAYVQDYEPFKLIKTDPKKTEAVLWNLLYGLANVTLMLLPFMPETADKIMDSLNISVDREDLGDFEIEAIENLFPPLN